MKQEANLDLSETPITRIPQHGGYSVRIINIVFHQSHLFSAETTARMSLSALNEPAWNTFAYAIASHYLEFLSQ